MNKYFKHWNFMRVLRLLIGLIILVQGIQTNEWMFVILGGLFALMPLLNIGCCASSGCKIDIPKSDKN